MNCILFESETERLNLLPFTFTRPISNIRIGILTIAEKWEKHLHASISYLTVPYLAAKYPMQINEINMFINGSFLPSNQLVAEIKSLKPGQALFAKDVLIASYTFDTKVPENAEEIQTACTDYIQIGNTYDIFSKNDAALRADFELITAGRTSAPISATNGVVNPSQIFIEDDAIVEFSTLNASTGPIYIGKHTEIMEGCKIRGPFALCDYGGLKMDAKIYGATTIGPHCKAGGELNNVVMFGYSNKGHDGFLGNAVIGEWCNIGADTNNSNLKNTYEEVKLWNYRTGRFEKTGLTFCGLMMGDHSKCGINTMFNTGTVVGVAANIFGTGFPRQFVPSFAWGGAHGFETFKIDKAIHTAKAMCSRRNYDFNEMEQEILHSVFEQSAKYRYWE